MKSLLRSFAAGQIAQELYGRLDLVKNQTGLALVENFETMAHGPARNGAGFGYVLEVKNSAKAAAMIPFSFSTTQSMALEFGDQYIRFHTQGGTLLETGLNVTAITQASPGVLTSAGHGYSSGQTVFFSGIGGMVTLNGRFLNTVVIDANTFSLVDFAGNAISTAALPAFTAGGTVARVYEIATPYLEADLLDIHYEQSADVLTLVHPSYQQRELRRLGATNWTLTTLAFAPTIATPAAPTLAAVGPGGGTPVSINYQATAIASDGLEESLPSPVANISRDLTVAGNAVDVTPAAVVGAIRYNIYKQISGVYGYIGQTTGVALRDQNITPNVGKTPPLVNDPFVGAGNFPGAVGYSGQRRCFGGTTLKPQNFAATQPGTESNMSYSIPSLDSDAVFFRLATRDSQTIRHIVDFTDLVIGTNNALWRVVADTTQPLSPSNIDPKIQSTVGMSNVRPLVVGRNLVYFEDAGGRVREANYAWQIQGYDSKDISLMAPDLFDGFTIKSAAYTRVPTPILWGVRSDGVLLGCTYMPEEDVRGWHQRKTATLAGQSSFESVCSVKESGIDTLYAIVRRSINGRSVRYVEFKHSRQFATPADAFFVDSGLTYAGGLTNVLTGLYHLEGEKVNVLIDGATHPQVTVTGGSITLQAPGSKVQVGLPIRARLMTLPLGLEGQALGQGTQKNVDKAYMRFVSSSGVTAGPDFDHLTPIKQRTSEPYGTPAALMSTEKAHTFTPSWGPDASVCIQTTEPQPVTLSSMTLDIAIGG